MAINLQLKNISKAYKSNMVLDGIDLNIGSGIYGFLGANGVGKTTLFKIISGYITSFSGEVIYPNFNRRKEVMMGVLPQAFSGYPGMKVREFLLYLGSIKLKTSKNKLAGEIDEKIELFNLKKVKDKKLKTISGGQLRRVGLAQAFLFNPKIVLLDEPTTGLDPTERIKFKNYIAEAGRDQIILLSTHIVPDLEAITKEIFILKDRRFVMNGTETELSDQCMGYVWEKELEGESELNKTLAHFTVSMISNNGTKTKVKIISDVSPLPNAVKVKPTLNDVYLLNFKEEANPDVI